MSYKVPHVMSINGSLLNGRYFPLAHGNGENNGLATEAEAQFSATRDGTWSGLSIYVATANASGDTTITVRKNGVDTALTLTIPQNSTGYFSNTTDSVSVTVGDLMSIGTTTSAGSLTLASSITTMFESDNGDTIQHMVSFGALSLTSNPRYTPIAGTPLANTIEAQTQVRIGHSTTITDMAVYISTNTKPSATTFTVRKNTADGSNSVVVGASSTGLFTSTGGTSFSAGNVANILASFSSANSFVVSNIQTTFVSSNPREITLLGAGNNFTSFGGTLYFIPGGLSNSIATENQSRTYLNAGGVLSNLAYNADANSATTISTLTMRINGSSGNQVVTIPATTVGIQTDSSNTDTIDNDDYLTVRRDRTGGSGGTIWRSSSVKFTMDEIVGSTFIPYVMMF